MHRLDGQEVDGIDGAGSREGSVTSAKRSGAPGRKTMVARRRGRHPSPPTCRGEADLRPNASLRGNGARAPGGAVGSRRNDEAFYEGKLCGETWRLGGGQDVARAMASVPHSLAVPLVCARLVRSTTAGLGEVRKRPIVDHHPINAAPRPENSKNSSSNNSLTTWTHFCYSAHGPTNARPISFHKRKRSSLKTRS